MIAFCFMVLISAATLTATAGFLYVLGMKLADTLRSRRIESEAFRRHLYEKEVARDIHNTHEDWDSLEASGQVEVKQYQLPDNSTPEDHKEFSHWLHPLDTEAEAVTRLCEASRQRGAA